MSSSSSNSSVHSRSSSFSSHSAPAPTNLPSVLAPGPTPNQLPNGFPTTPPQTQQPHYFAYAQSYPFPPSSQSIPSPNANQWSSVPPQQAAQSAPLPRTLGSDPYAYLYTSNVPEVPSANVLGSGGRHPIVGRRQRVSVACTYCRRRKIRCDGAEVCSNCSRASRQCEYTAVTEESVHRERDLSQRRRRVAPTEIPMPYTPSGGYVTGVLGTPMTDWSPTSEYLTSPTLPNGPSNGFLGPAPMWSTNGHLPSMTYEKPSVNLNTPATISQRGFTQTTYPSSSLSGYGGGGAQQQTGWQPSHAANSSSTLSIRSAGRPFHNVSIGTPFLESQYGMIESTDTFYMGNQTLSPPPSTTEEIYRPQLSRISTYPMAATPRYTPASRNNSPDSKTSKDSHHSYISNPLASPPQTPLFEVPSYTYSINPSELQSVKGMSGLNIMVPFPTTSLPGADGGMRHLFEGVQGLESNGNMEGGNKISPPLPPPPPYSIMV